MLKDLPIQLATTVLDRLDFGIAIIDGSFLVRYCNKWLCDRAGPEQPVGKTLQEVFGGQLDSYVPEAIGQVLRRGWASRLSHALHPRPFPLLAGGASVWPDTDRKDQDVKQAVDLAPIPLEDGSRGCLIEIRDVTEIVRRERNLRHQADVANSANRSKSEFLANMSHELRTPLNAVLGYAQILQFNTGSNLTSTDIQQARNIEQSGRHLLGLINDVLELAAIEGQRIKIDIEACSVQPMLDRIYELMNPIALKNFVQLIIDRGENACVRADPLRLSQCLINLVSNAIKYNCRGGTVRVGLEGRPGGRVRIFVADTGAGIPRSMQHLVFQAFQRLGAERTAVEGTGIGLSIVKGFVQKMDGSIGFVSDEGVGSTFWIELPAGEHNVETTAASAAQDPAIPEPGLGFSLLYVEDIPSNQQLMEHVVARRDGVKLLSASTPSLGLELAVAHCPTIIVLDINLPEMDGYEVLRRLRAMPETRLTPVLALSAAAMPEDIARGRSAGFFDYLTKPLDIPHFLSRVGAALDKAA